MLVKDWSLVGKNFWEVNPKFLSVNSFKEYYDLDTSTNKILSSKTLWGLAFLLDYDSPYFNMEESERYKLIKPMYFEECEPPKNLITNYNLLQKDSEKRLLEVWNKKADELAFFLEGNKLDFDNADQIVKLMLSLDKILDLKDSIDKRIAKADTKTKNRAGGEASLLEQGIV